MIARAPRAVPITILALVLTAGAIAVLARGADALSCATWLAMSVAILAPLAVVPELRKQAFDPYSFFVFTWATLFVLPGFLVLWQGNDPYLHAFPAAAALVTGAAVLFFLGYHSPLGPWIARRLPLARFPRAGIEGHSRRTFFLIAGALYGLGWVGRLASAAAGYSHLPRDLGSAFRYLNLLHQLVDLGKLAFVAMAFLVLTGPFSRARKVLSIGTLTLLEILGGALDGGRSEIVLPILFLLFVASYAWRPVSWIALVGIYLVGIVVAGPLLTVYRDAYYSAIMGGAHPGPITALASAATVVTSTFTGSVPWKDLIVTGMTDRLTGTFLTMLRVLAKVPSVFPFAWGSTFFPGVLLIFIPRLFWPGKPQFMPGRAFDIMFWNDNPGQTFGTSTGVGMPAEAYMNFAFFGILAFVILGVVLRCFADRLDAYRRTEALWIVRAFVITFVFSTLADAFVFYLSDLVLQSVLVLAFLTLVHWALPRVSTDAERTLEATPSG